MLELRHSRTAAKHPVAACNLLQHPQRVPLGGLPAVWSSGRLRAPVN